MSQVPASVQQYLDLEDQIRKLRSEAEALESHRYHAGKTLAAEFPDVLQSIDRLSFGRRKGGALLDERLIERDSDPILVQFRLTYDEPPSVTANARRITRAFADKLVTTHMRADELTEKLLAGERSA